MRRKLLGTFALMVLVAVAGGAVITALAGARRTDSAYPRMRAATNASDVTVIEQGFGFVPADEVAELPQVARAGGVAGFGLADRPANGVPTDFSAEFSGASIDGTWVYELDGALVFDGRLPDPERVDEIAVNEAFLQNSGLAVGDTYQALIVDFEKLGALEASLQGREPTSEELADVYTPVDLEIVGAGRAPSDLVVNENEGNSAVVLTPAFARRFADRIGYEFTVVELRDAKLLGEFEAAARQKFAGTSLDFQTALADTATFDRTVQPYVDALRLFALAAAIAGLFVIGQAIARVVSADATDAAVLEAVGTTRRQRAAIAGVRAAAIAVGGAAGAVVVAIGASPLLPVGVARRAEPDPGIRVDAGVLVLGAGAIVVLVVSAAAWFAWRATRPAAEANGERVPRPGRVVGALVSSGAPVPVVNGVRFAVQRERAELGWPGVTAVIGLVAAIAAIGAALVFATNLDHLVATPARYGWTWDAILDTYDSGTTEELEARVSADRDLASVTIGSRTSLFVDGRNLAAFGFESVRGDSGPRAVRGRMPERPREIAVGAATLADLDAEIGDTVVAQTVDGRDVRLRIVGQTLLPSLWLNSSPGFSEGIATTADTITLLDAEIRPSFFLVDVRNGVDAGTVADRYRTTRSFGAELLGPQRPGDIRSYERVRATPLLLATLLAVLAVGVLAHLLVTSVRTRRRDLAILKTLGLSRRQVAATVAWQATTLAVIALVLGLPAGVIVGRWVWHRFAGSLGIEESVAIPAIGFVTIVVAVVLLSNLIASFPARSAAATRPRLF